MSYPNFPNPARRARILQAHQLRQQGLTLREIARIMGCAHSTVAGYLRDYELFRFDLMRELASDQIVTNAIHLADVESEHFDRRLAASREFRLLLNALPEMRRDEDDRTIELTNGSVHVDRYGNRYPVPNRTFPPTEAEQRQSMEPPAKLPAGRPSPDVPLHCPPIPLTTAEQNETTRAASEEVPTQSVETVEAAETSPIRTESNKTEQESAPDPASSPAPNPAQEGTSADSDQDSGQHAPDPSIQTLQEAIKRVDRQLERHNQHRNWLKDFPPHNPWHPERERALELVQKKQDLEAQLAEITNNPAAA